MLLPDTSSIKARQRVVSAKDFDPLKVDCPPTDNLSMADIAMVGEAPSGPEVAEKEPFVGPSGAQLNRICAAVNLPRYRIYLTNACKAQLPGNNTDKLWTYRGYKHPAWSQLQRALIDELAEFPGRVIVCLGATAMKLLLDGPATHTITKLRGSIYLADDYPHLMPHLKGKLICPTFHPASSLPRSNPINFWIMCADLAKFLRVNDDPCLLEPQLVITTQPTLTQVLEYYSWCKQHSTVGFDIEATPTHVTCFALSATAQDVMSIPLMDNRGNYWTPTEEVQIWQGLAEILGDPSIGVICQNGMFDIMFILRTLHIVTDNFHFDTMIAQHICYTDLPKGLDFLTSVYTYHPYYKDEGKLAHLSAIKDWPSYWQYNAKDAAYLHPIADRLKEELHNFEAEDAMTYSMDLHKPLMEMEWNGILTDRTGIEAAKKKFSRLIRAMLHGLSRVTGEQLNINSSKQLIAYFYYKLQLKPYTNRSTGRPTCDAVALSRIAKKKKGMKNQQGAVAARLILKIRKYQKLMSTYFSINVDEDNKLRCSHKITGTVSGRIATEKTFFGTGANLQNQPYIYKKYLIPDPEHLICEVDLAKAEAHVVAYLTQDANMMEAFESGVDVHSFNASKIFNIPIEAVTKEQRNMGKRVVHASNYNMGPQTFSDNLAKDGTYYSQSQCKELLSAYNARFPGLHRWHREIDMEVQSTRLLYNLYGRPKRFYGMMNTALFRNAYSYIPQSTVAELLNRGTIAVSNDPDFGQTKWDIDLLTTVHDSDVFQFHISQCPNLLDILLRIQHHMHHEFHHKGRSFSIGLDAKLGWSWAGRTVEISEFTKENIEEALHKLGV